MRDDFLVTVYLRFNLLKYIVKSKSLIEDLHNRLVEDYNGGEAFNQYEEDRLITSKVLELIDRIQNGATNDMIQRGFDQEGKEDE